MISVELIEAKGEGSLVVMEVTVVNNSGVKNRSVGLYNIICLFRDHTRRSAILRIH